ncbi:MAG: hypothetical protein ABIQ04_01595 [Candidatus Saccharimonadales bacterium]
MYSGTTLRTKSGLLMGVHQKIDRVARRHIKPYLSREAHFPVIHDILHFEGLNGPDGIKRKSPARDEPWHYVDPSNGSDRELITMILDHIENLSVALRDNNNERAAFEAAWMAHAITDGLTPAHHYPLEEKLEELRGGEGLETRTSTKDKLVIPGKNRREQLRNNWEFWGAKGVMTTHLAFEMGVATTIVSARFEDAGPSQNDIIRLQSDGFEALFHEALQRVAHMKMYEEFGRLGWTRHLAIETNETLIPEIIKTVVLGWYQATIKAKK